LADGFSFLESPRWRDGALYASDFFSHRVLRFDADGGAEEICEVPGQPSGLGWTPAGALLISSRLDRRLLRLEGDGSLALVADLGELAPWHTNDLIVDELGGAYVGNFGWDDTADPRIQPTVLIRVAPDGRAAVVATDLVFPNGMALSPDGRTLIVAETFAGRVSAFERAADGTLGARRAWADFAPGRYATIPELIASGSPLPDGIALDAEGALWMADAAGTAALRVADGGEVLERVESGDERAVYAVALGGDDGKTLFMCTSVAYGKGDPTASPTSRILTAQVDVAAAVPDCRSAPGGEGG
jgi:sugar lactone lactonase YvrE